MAVEKRLKPAVIVQGMLFCGAAPLSSEITVAVEKRLKPAVIVQGMLFCGAAPLSCSREKIKTCSYCTRYVILWCCPLSSEITVAVEKRLKPAVIVQGMLFCGAAPLSSE